MEKRPDFQNTYILIPIETKASNTNVVIPKEIRPSKNSNAAIPAENGSSNTKHGYF